MTDITLRELYQWARAHLDQPIMLGYLLFKVNGQVPSRIFILLKMPDSERPNAEIEVESTQNADGVCVYKVVFHALPFNTKIPNPRRLRDEMQSQKQVIYWIKTGNRRNS